MLNVKNAPVLAIPDICSLFDGAQEIDDRFYADFHSCSVEFDPSHMLERASRGRVRVTPG